MIRSAWLPCTCRAAGKVEIDRLGTGLVNETYRVLRDGRAYAMRLAVSNRVGLGLDRAWEARVLESAVAADLAPALEYCDPQRGILITRWVDGPAVGPGRGTPAVEYLENGRFDAPYPCLADSGSGALHESGEVDRALLCSGAAECSAERRYRDRGRSGCRKGWQCRHDTARGGDAALAELAALPSVGPALCHSDLHTLNLIDEGGSLVLLDWEYAHVSDPLWDLAGWGANNDFEESIGHDLLASYLGRRPTGDECLRLQLLSWLYDYVCLCWSELYLDLRRPTRAEERRRALRCKATPRRRQFQPGLANWRRASMHPSSRADQVPAH